MDTNKISWPGWETVRLIGRGSFGAVYEIQRDVFGDIEKAALKVISIPQNSSDIDELYSEGYDDESITSTFQSHLKSIVAEYSLMRKMSSCPNIVNCDDVRYVQHDDGIGWDIFIKMELLTPLLKALPAQIPEDMVTKLATDICRALEVCSKYHVVHRDIKPQNIFVSENGDFKLGDFGIAKTVEKTMGGTKIGTYKYMAPEVYNNQPYGSGADIYSLGLVMYFLLNERRLPFLPLPPEKLKAGLDETARNRRLSGEQLPPPVHGSKKLKDIVLKACAYDPKDRYHSAAEMLEALQGNYAAPKPVEEKQKLPEVATVPKIKTGEESIGAEDDNSDASIVLDDADEATLQLFKIKAESASQPEKSEPAEIKQAKLQSVQAQQSTQAQKAATSKSAIVSAQYRQQYQKSNPEKGDKAQNISAQENASTATTSAAMAYGQQYQKAEPVQKQQSAPTQAAGKKRKIVSALIGVVVLVVAVLLLLHFCGISLLRSYPVTQTETYGMPNVTGQTLTQAKNKLSEMGMIVTVTYEKNNSVQENRVISQSVGTGTSIASGTKIVLTVSSGKDTVNVANVAGKTENAAIQELERQGFSVKVERKYDNAVAEGKVVSQDPHAGSSQLPGVAVTIYVSKGPQPVQITFDAAGGNVQEKSRTVLYGKTIGTLPEPTRNGYEFMGWFTSDGKQIKANSTVNTSRNFTLTAKWSTASYQVSWNTGTGYTIVVKRTSSPKAGASTGTLSNGAKIYYGDVLSVTYTASTGYRIARKGSTSITVTGDVTASSIYASVEGDNYTYNIVYKSVNGTSLGSSSATYQYGTTNTITPKAFSGYTSPSSQSVKWDTTSAKTITFTYTPSSVGSTNKSGSIYKTSTYDLAYSATIEHRNRTATSVQIRIRWKATLWGATDGAYNAYSQRFRASSGSVSTGTVVIIPYGTWAAHAAGTRSATETSDWITIPVNTTNATTIALSIYYWQENRKGQDASTITADPAANLSTTWSIPIPAY